LRQIPIADEPEYVGHQQLAVPARRAVGWQNAVIDPALDGRNADAERLRDLRGTDVPRLGRLCQITIRPIHTFLVPDRPQEV
jgi:hypothetical protein